MIYRSKIIRLKCSLNRSYINYGELHCDSFLKIVWVVWLERVVPNSFWTSLTALRSLNCFIIATLWSNRVLHAHREADVNQTCQQSVFSPIGACIRIWCTAGAVERRSQMFVYRPFRFSLSPPRSTKGLFTGYLDLGITNLLFAVNTHVYNLYSFAYPIDYSYSVLSFCSWRRVSQHR